MPIIHIPREEAFKIIKDSRAVIVASEAGDLCYPEDNDDIIRLHLNGDINITIDLDQQDVLIKMDSLDSQMYLEDDEGHEVILIPLINRVHSA
jgi:hypothetical protein